ncbi:hypothetical protein [Streptomyces sp. NBC_00162]|uniref:hypothetical protein n=1 Tax=Streptomyces sp. NBC_00162 TaxID=2903629 RepID=UPI00214C73E4|nr:hypothetical protein [Streptomyces sp. NBC_00162]UUU41540.1 hypothetical protein JIW86_23565 [Streptomyces sp. NBC_00162]
MDEVRIAERRRKWWDGFPPGPRRTRNTLFWATLIPVTATAGGILTQFPYGLRWLGVLIVLAAAGTGAAMAGTGWHRSGVAAIVGFGTLTLGVFAGISLYEAYAKQLGERVDALVVETGERTGLKGDTRPFCRVADPSGTIREVAQQQGCRADFEPGRRITLFEDPLGILAPRIGTSPDRTLDPFGPTVTGGLFLLVTATLVSGGQRRRSDRDLLEQHRRRTAGTSGRRSPGSGE